LLSLPTPHIKFAHRNANSGSIHEGGELGYSLSHAYGAVLDKPDLTVACIVGDGEAETGPMATSWHSNKFLNPATDGTVLPILHLNGFKIANPCVLARIPESELLDLFKGYGYDPIVVSGDDPAKMHPEFSRALDEALDKIQVIREKARAEADSGKTPARPCWPMVVLRSPKGWTGPKTVDGEMIEDSWRSHQVPVNSPSQNPEHLKVLEDWLRSYEPDKIFDADGKLKPELQALAPPPHLCMGDNPYTNPTVRPLIVPDFGPFGIRVDPNDRGSAQASDTFTTGQFLREVFKANERTKNFRLFGPDETASNRLQAVFDETKKTWMGEYTDKGGNDDLLSPTGRVMEMLSEHQCEGWLEGYLLTGGHGLLNSYEAFIHIISSMFNQHAKWLKITSEIPWRNKLSSLNMLLASHVWRQDHVRDHQHSFSALSRHGPLTFFVFLSFNRMDSPIRTLVSFNMSPRRSPESFVSTCHLMPTLCCPVCTIACSQSTMSTSWWLASTRLLNG